MKKRKLNINAGEPLVDEGPEQGRKKGEEPKNAKENCHTHFPPSFEAAAHLQISGYQIYKKNETFLLRKFRIFAKEKAGFF